MTAAQQDNRKYVLNYFAQRREHLSRFVQPLLSPDVSSTDVVAEAEVLFTHMVDDLAYVDSPRLVLAEALFFCTTYLALYQVVRGRGVDVHDFGRAVLTRLSDLPGVVDEQGGEQQAPNLEGPGTHPGEFVAEVVTPQPGDGFVWGYNVKFCAICYQFGRFDAMDLVPYMCASDDIFSAKGNQGLQRTGTIALGAHQCDFRYAQGRPPRRVADAFPERIKFVH